MKRVGVYAGTFDPVHAGHVSFALQAVHHAKLDKLYFLPERRPRRKDGVEHFGHRVAMLKHAAQPHPKFAVLELNDISFTVKRTLPALLARFRGDQLVFLFGSDAAQELPAWPQAEQLLSIAELVVGCREKTDSQSIQRVMEGWSTQPKSRLVLSSYAPQVSSERIRTALRNHQPAQGILKSVERYSNRNWLYISLASGIGN